MRSLLTLLCSSRFAGALAWAVLGACIDAPAESGPAVARLVTTWDPLACGEPHRIVVELGDEGGAPSSASGPCNLGVLTLDLAHFGGYRGRIYAWALAAPIRSIAPLELTIDEPIVRWPVATPR
jgi:hypothetical protein